MSYLLEARTQILLALPVSLSLFLRKSVDICALVFVGHLPSNAEHYLSAAGMASVTANVTGNSMLIGLAGALTTLCSQAHGSGDKEALCLALQRSFLILPLLVSLPVSVLWVFSASVLEFFGQEQALAQDSRDYLVALLPALWAYSLSLSIQNWLHSQERMVPVSVVTLIVAVLHPIWSYLLVMYLGFGFIGAAYAVSLSKCLEFLLLVGYLQCSGVLADNNFRWSAKCLDINGWIPYLQYGLPNLLMMSEWWASEVVIFMSGRLPSPEREVAATSIYQSLNSVCFMLPCGFQVSGATRVGNCLGANDASGAQISSRVAPVLALAISVVSSIAVLSLRTELGRAFTDDSEVLVILRSLILVLAGYVLADGVQSALTGVLKGMGRQSDAAPVVVVAYYAVGLPLSAYLGFSFGFGLGSVGLCLGTMAGTVLQMAAYSLICLRTDWSAEAEAAQIKLLQRRAVDEAEDDWWTLDYKAPPPRPRKPLVQSFQSFMSRLLGFEDEVRYELVSLGETGRPVAGRVQSMFDDDGDDRI